MAAEETREKTRLKAVPAALVPVVLTAAGLGVGFAAGWGVGARPDRDAGGFGSGSGSAASASVDADPGDQGPSAALATLAVQARALRFVPPHGSLPHCADFAGTGTIPPGATLLIFDHPAGSDGALTAGGYDYDGRAASATSGTWEADNRWIGTDDPSDAGQYTEMSAVLVPTGAAEFLDSVPNAYTASWQASVLRLGTVADTMLVRRGSDTRPCPR